MCVIIQTNEIRNSKFKPNFKTQNQNFKQSTQNVIRTSRCTSFRCATFCSSALSSAAVHWERSCALTGNWMLSFVQIFKWRDLKSPLRKKTEQMSCLHHLTSHAILKSIGFLILPFKTTNRPNNRICFIFPCFSCFWKCVIYWKK
jgi:hypothetical protein